MLILNPDITSTDLIRSLVQSFNNLENIRQEAALPKQVVIEFLENFKDEANEVKSMVMRNYEKDEVDKVISNVDELIEKVKQDPPYFLDKDGASKDLDNGFTSIPAANPEIEEKDRIRKEFFSSFPNTK